MRGRPNVPTALHELKGNPSKLNLNKQKEDEPKYDMINPDSNIVPPDYLNDLGKQTYIELSRKIADKSILSNMDMLGLELLIEAYQEFRFHQAFLERNGYSYEVQLTSGDTGSKPFPEVQMKQDAHKRVVALLVQYGWTPSSRAKTKIIKNQVDPVRKVLGGRGK